MEVEAGCYSVVIPDLYEIKEFAWKHLNGVFQAVECLGWTNILMHRIEFPRAKGNPVYFGECDGRIEFYPATNRKGEFRIIYTVLKKI